MNPKDKKKAKKTIMLDKELLADLEIDDEATATIKGGQNSYSHTGCSHG